MDDGKGASGKGGAPDSSAPERSLKLKISKKAYVFDVKRKYAATRSFAVKKKPETPAEGLKDGLQALFKGKKPLAGGDGAQARPRQPSSPLAEPQKKPPSALKYAAIIAFAVLLLFFLAIGFIVMQYGGGMGEEGPPPSSSFSGAFSASIGQQMLLSSGQTPSPTRTAYFLLELRSQNVTGANLSVQLFNERPLSQVFILDHARESADSYPQFHSELSSRLSALGISVNEIGLESVGSLPEGALLIVPTGYFPLELLGQGGATDYKQLLSRGMDIIYIGLPFDTLALDKSGSAVRTSNSDIAFVKSRPESSDGLLLYDSQYVASPGKTGAEAGISPLGMLYGAVSAVRGGNGVMLFVPQFLDGGWVTDADSSGAQKAARDISRIIYDEAWLKEIASAEANVSQPPDIGKVSLYSSPFEGDSAFARLSETATDADGISSRAFSVLGVTKAQKGEITPRDSQTVPYYLSGLKTRLNLALKEKDSTPVKLFVVMYKDGVELQRSEFELGLTNPTIEKSVDFQVNAEPGNYVLTVEDNYGKVYAATMLTVIDLDIELTYANWQEGGFNFSLSAAGKPVSPPSMSVAIDGKGEQQYSVQTLARSPTATTLAYGYRGKIEPGMHNFTFSTGAWSKKFEAEYYQRRNIWDNPIVLVLGFVSLVIFGIGTLLRRPEVLRYGLDIPDFPPLSTIKIPVKRETVLEIFDNVNAGYSWKWMPLRPEEVKGGFRKLTYNGKPILIGDFNLERVLSKLSEDGAVKEELGYWGLARWEKESNHSIRYLMIYRILRNVFVNNAVKFSKLDAIPECDIKAVVGNEELYLHFMEEPRERVAHRALATVGKGHTIIVFKTPEEADDFRRALNSPSKLAVALKMEVNSKNILLLPVKEAVSAFLKGIGA